MKISIRPDPDLAIGIAKCVDTEFRASLRYVSTVMARENGALQQVVQQDDLASPFAFAIYNRIVHSLEKDAFEDAAEWTCLLNKSWSDTANSRIISWLDRDISPAVWEACEAVIDTDPDRDFRLLPATSDEFIRFSKRHDEAMILLDRYAPVARVELEVLANNLFLARPRSQSQSDRFGGASAFFLWRGCVFNAAPDRDIGGMLDVLIHEASHMLLFGIGLGHALTENPPDARYRSPLRSDPRPMEGIVHAVFVASRVHAVLSPLAAAMPEGPDRASVARRAVANKTAALRGLDTVREHACLSVAGKTVAAAIEDYWNSFDVSVGAEEFTGI